MVKQLFFYADKFFSITIARYLFRIIPNNSNKKRELNKNSARLTETAKKLVTGDALTEKRSIVIGTNALIFNV